MTTTGARASDWLDRWYEPQWAVGWAYARVLWVIAATFQYGLDVFSIPDVWGAPDLHFVAGGYRLARYVVLTPPGAYLWWSSIMLTIAAVAVGGRTTKAAWTLFLVLTWGWLAYEAANVKAHDRLLLFVTLALLLGPTNERGLATKRRSPFARWVMMSVFSAAYGATGMWKFWHEPTWLTDGSVLANHLVQPFHGSRPLGVWLSGQAWLLPALTIATVAWECAFPVLIWFKRATAPLLVVGVIFHTTLLLTMNLGPFALVAFAAYPVLLHPDDMMRLHLALFRRRRPKRPDPRCVTPRRHGPAPTTPT